MKNLNTDIQASNRIISIINNSKDQYDRILDELESAYVIINDKFEIIEANKQFAKIKNQPFFRDDVLSYFHSGSTEQLRVGILNVIETNQPVTIELKTYNGRSYLFIIALLPVRRTEEGVVLKLLGADITELREREGLILDVFRTVSVGLVLINSENKIISGYSNFTKIILENSNLDGADVFDVFFDKNLKKFNAEEQRSMSDLRDFSGKDKNYFTAATFNVPKLFEIPSMLRIGGKRVIQATLEPIEEEGVVNRYLMILQDMSEFVNLNPLTITDDLAKMVKMIEHDPESLIATLEDVDSMMERGPEHIGTDITEELKGILHSVKGMLRMIGVSYLGGLIHTLESEIKLMQEGKPVDHDLTWQKFIVEYAKFKQVYTVAISQDGAPGSTQVVDDKLVNVMTHLNKASSEIGSHLFLSPVIGLDKGTFSDISELGNFSHKLIEKNSNDMGFSAKPVMELQQFWLSDVSLSPIKSAIVHLINNSFAHGFSGLENTNNLEISLTSWVDDGVLVLDYKDNGVGVNTKKIREKLIAANPEKKADIEKQTDEESANFVFSSGVSTKDEVDELSGRGVGLSSAQFEIERLGGSLKLVNFRKGCHFQIKLPLVDIALENYCVVGADVVKKAIEIYWPDFSGKFKQPLKGLFSFRYPALFFKAFDALHEKIHPAVTFEFSEKPLNMAPHSTITKPYYLFGLNGIQISYDSSSNKLSFYFANNMAAKNKLNFTLNLKDISKDQKLLDYLSSVSDSLGAQISLTDGPSDLILKKSNNTFVPSVFRSIEQRMLIQLMGSQA